MLLKDIQISFSTFLKNVPTPTDEELTNHFVEQIKKSTDYFVRENFVELFAAIGSNYLTETNQNLPAGELAKAFCEFDPELIHPANPFAEQFEAKSEVFKSALNRANSEHLSQKERLILNSLGFYITEQLRLVAQQYLTDRLNLDDLLKSATERLTNFTTTDYARMLCQNFTSSLEEDIVRDNKDSTVFKDLFNTNINNKVDLDSGLDLNELKVVTNSRPKKPTSKVSLFIQLMILRLIAELSFSTAMMATGTLIGGLLGTVLFPGIGTIAGGTMGGALFGLASSQAFSWLRYFSSSISTQISGIITSASTLSIAGALTGAAVGSIFPGIGTALGAVIGSVCGFLTAVIPMITMSITSLVFNKKSDLTIQRLLYGSSYHRCRSRLINTNFSPRRIKNLNNYQPEPVVTVEQNSNLGENVQAQAPTPNAEIKSDPDNQAQLRTFCTR